MRHVMRMHTPAEYQNLVLSSEAGNAAQACPAGPSAWHRLAHVYTYNLSHYTVLHEQNTAKPRE